MITVQKAKIEDVDEVKKLLFTTWTFAYKNILTPDQIKRVTSKWHAPEVLSKEIRNFNNVFLIARVDNKIVGLCNAEAKQHGRKIYIERVHILPDHHRQGIGSKLIEEVLRFYPNAISVNLEVEKENNHAFKFYEALGFKSIGEKKFIVDGIQMNCWVMEKLLDRKNEIRHTN